MKSEGEIRQKLKQVKFRHAKKVIDLSLERCSSNCLHNASLQVPGAGEVSLCTLNPNELVVCDSSRGLDLAPECRFYQCRFNKDDLKLSIEGSFQAPLSEIASRYPDAAALIWVLEESPSEEISLQERILVGTFSGAPIFTDSQENVVSISRDLDRIQNEPQRIANTLTSEMSSLKGELLKSEEAFQVLKKHVAVLEEQLKELKESKDYLSSRTAELEKENLKLRSSWLPGIFR